MIKAVIFDVDGVLVDTVPYHFEAWKRMFEKAGSTFNFDDYLEKVNGLPRAVGIKNILTTASDADLDKLADMKQRYFLEMIDQKPPKTLPGVLQLLQKLVKNSFYIAAASSSKNAPFVLEKTGLVKYFNIIVSGHDFKKPKPDPEIFLTAAKKLGANPKECIVVEDAYHGVEAGKKGGMYTIGLLTSNDQKIKQTADLALSDLKNYQLVLKHVLNLNSGLA